MCRINWKKKKKTLHKTQGQECTVQSGKLCQKKKKIEC